MTLGIRENPFMARHGVDRLVVQSTHGVGSTIDDLAWSWKLFFRLILQPQIKDSERQESVVRGSGTEWVLVQPVSPTDDPADDVLASPDGKLRSMKVPRQSVARVLADATQLLDWIDQAVSVSA